MKNKISKKRTINAETKKNNQELVKLVELFQEGLIRPTNDGHIQCYNKTTNEWDNAKQYPLENGYTRIKLYPKVYAYEHDAVFVATYGIAPGELDHKDTSKNNNKIENLEVVSHTENLRRRGAYKKHNFTKEDFSELLEALKAGVKKIIAVCEMAAKYACSAQTIRNHAKRLGIYWVKPRKASAAA